MTFSFCNPVSTLENYSWGWRPMGFDLEKLFQSYSGCIVPIKIWNIRFDIWYILLPAIPISEMCAINVNNLQKKFI